MRSSAGCEHVALHEIFERRDDFVEHAHIELHEAGIAREQKAGARERIVERLGLVIVRGRQLRLQCFLAIAATSARDARSRFRRHGISTTCSNGRGQAHNNPASCDAMQCAESHDDRAVRRDRFAARSKVAIAPRARASRRTSATNVSRPACSHGLRLGRCARNCGAHRVAPDCAPASMLGGPSTSARNGAASVRKISSRLRIDDRVERVERAQHGVELRRARVRTTVNRSRLDARLRFDLRRLHRSVGLNHARIALGRGTNLRSLSLADGRALRRNRLAFRTHAIDGRRQA